MRYALGLAVGLILPVAAFAQSTPITGTWSLVSLTEDLSLHIVASTFPNFGGTDQKGTVTVKGDSLTLVREILGGAEPFTSTLELIRMK